MTFDILRDNNLEEYWKHGKGAVEIAWGTPGDWTRCEHKLRKHVGSERAKRICAQWHHEMTGLWPGDKKNRNGDSMDNNIEMEIRSFNEEERTVVGLAIPYDQTIEVSGFSERFERGAITDVSNVKLFWQHKEPIGKVVLGRETPNGYEIEARISKTPKGDEVYTLLKDGVIDKFSVGFVPVTTNRDGDTFIRTKVTLKEVSLVPFPAYSGAGVSQVREEKIEKENDEIIMENDFDYSGDITELRDSVTSLERKFDKFNEQDAEAFACQYRSGGEMLKGLAKGEQSARELLTRDFATTVEADVTRPAWINKKIKFIESQRVVKGVFNQEPLPATGMKVEYPFNAGVSGAVAAQSAEGADLPYLEVSVDTRTADIVTYGGWSSVDRQAIERSDISYLEAVLEFQVRQYAKATEAAVQAALLAATGTNTAVELGGANNAAHTAAQWIEAVLDARAAVLANSFGLDADVVLVAADVHKKLALIVDGAGRPIFDVNRDGANTFGTLNLGGNLGGVIAGIPVVVGVNLPNGTAIVASRSALTTWEAPGAPFRLQDENVVNLTKDFSLYGYLAIGVTDPKGITKIVDAT